jgi:hypothetical protein
MYSGLKLTRCPLVRIESRLPRVSERQFEAMAVCFGEQLHDVCSQEDEMPIKDAIFSVESGALNFIMGDECR